VSKNSIVKKTFLWIIAVVLILALSIGVMFRNEIKTMMSLEKVDNYPLYTMEYTSDYGFDDFLNVGASSDNELIEFIAGKLLKGLPVKIDVADLSCTTFNAATPTGDHIFGRNFDMNYSPALLVHTKPVNGYESISMVNLAFVGYGEDYLPEQFFNRIMTLAAPYVPLDGINEKGLSAGILLITDQPTNQTTDKIDITSSTAVRMLLDHAATVEEAVAMLKEYDMHDSTDVCMHYQIADAAGNSVVVEYVNNEMQVLKPETTYLACTNFYLTPGDKYNLGEGQKRYEIVMAGLNENKGIVTEEKGMDLLQAATTVKSLDEKTGILYNTQWSAIYNNTQKNVALCMGMDYMKTYNFSVADFAARTGHDK